MARRLGEGTVTILAALEESVRYGLDLTDRTGMLPGTVYTTLRRLERRQFVEGHWEAAEVAEKERRPRRRYYTLTSAGEAALVEARMLRDESAAPVQLADTAMGSVDG